MRGRRPVSDALLPLVREAPALERGSRVPGRLSPLRAGRGRLDERLPLVRPRRHRAESHSPGVAAGAPAAAGDSRQTLGIPYFLSARLLGVAPAWAQVAAGRAAHRG